MTLRMSDMTRRQLRRVAKPTSNRRLEIECLEDRLTPTPAMSVVSLGDVNESAGTVTFRSPEPRLARLRPSTSPSAERRPPGSLPAGTTTTTECR